MVLVLVPVAGEDVLKVNMMQLTAHWTDHCFSWERVEATLHEVFSEDKNCQFPTFLSLSQTNKTQAGIGFRLEKCNYQD